MLADVRCFTENRPISRGLHAVAEASRVAYSAPLAGAARMQTFLIIPCHNEARLIGRTAHSLGFGRGASPDPDTRLVLVDNASTDGTWEALEGIRKDAPSGSVLLAREDERGYVPPRHRGTVIASEVAASQGTEARDVLILQGDADTIYEAGYANAMAQAADDAGPDHVLEGRTHSPRRFLHDHPGFQELADLVDLEMAPFAVKDSADVIIDDKVSGYRLSDYARWGGHQRDYLSTGAEVHAETTRLFIRGRRFGAQKRAVDQAWALPSRRKIQRNPVRHFATAGFPREEAWWRAWNAAYEGPHDLGAFDDRKQWPALAPAIAMRKAHLRALFTTLPKAVALSLGRGVELEDELTEEIVRYAAIGQLGRLFEALLPAAKPETT